MKHISLLLAAVLLAAAAVGCWGGSDPSSSSLSSGTSTGLSSSAGDGKPVSDDYGRLLMEARPDEDNNAYAVYTLGGGAETPGWIPGFGNGIGEDILEREGGMALELLGLAPKDVEEAAFSVSLMNVQSYAVAVVRPAPGRSEAVQEQLRNFVQSQIQAQQNYLPEQYEIAKKALVETMPGGEVVLVMHEDADDVMGELRQSLRAL